jgi:hypothetical protein
MDAANEAQESDNEGLTERDDCSRDVGRLHQQLEPSAAPKDHCSGTGRQHNHGSLQQWQPAALRLNYQGLCGAGMLAGLPVDACASFPTCDQSWLAKMTPRERTGISPARSASAAHVLQV